MSASERSASGRDLCIAGWPTCRRRLRSNGSACSALVRAEDPFLSSVDVDLVVEQVFARVGGLGPLDPFLADPEVTEIMVNGGPVWIERRGRLERTTLFLTATTIEHLIERIVGPLGLRVDRSCPLVDARLPDGSRVNAVVPPLAVDGPCMTIRRFGARPIELEATRARRGRRSAALGVTDQGQHRRVRRRGGGQDHTRSTRSPPRSRPHERIVTVEDAAELACPASTWCGSRPVPLGRGVRSGHDPATSCATRCACGPTDSWSAKRAVPRRSTCSKR